MSGYVFTEISDPGAYETAAGGISPSGLVAGLSIATATSQYGQAFLYDPATGYTTLPALTNGGFDPDPVAVTDDGTVYGTYELRGTSAIEEFGFIYDAGVYTTIAPPDTTLSAIVAANQGGELLGYGESTTGYFAFTYLDGIYTTLPAFSNTYETIPSAINDAGAIVGTMIDRQNVHSAFLYSQSQLVDISFAGAQNSYASDINDTGEVVGYYAGSDGHTHGYTYDDGVYTTLDGPAGAVDVYTTAINDSGVIVGYYTDAADDTLGFVDKGGVYTTLSFEDDPTTRIGTITNAGEILGAAIDSSGMVHSFTAVEANCFLAGTAIATPTGTRSIERLVIGDSIMTAEGNTTTVRWIGRRTFQNQGRADAAGLRVADRSRILPVRVSAGALGNNLPSRDLLVSPCHALLIDGILIQAGALVNGISIRQETMVAETFAYYHLEVESHALILAEDVPAETFVDNVQRMGFDNWAEHQQLYPDARPIPEMNLPRAASRRQIPVATLKRLIAQAAAMGQLAA